MKKFFIILLMVIIYSQFMCFGVNKVPVIVELNEYFEVEYEYTGTSDFYFEITSAYRISNLFDGCLYRFRFSDATIFDAVGYHLGDNFHFYDKEGSFYYYHWYGPDNGVDTVGIEIDSEYETLQVDAEEEYELRIRNEDDLPIEAIATTRLQIVTSMEITGTYLDCSNPAYYYLENPANGSNLSWVIKQGAITRASGSGSTASASNLTNGEVEVTFNTNFTCGLDDLTFKDYFWFGKPVPSILGPDEVECFFPEWYFIDSDSYQWGDFEWSTDYLMDILGSTTGHKAEAEGLDEGYGQIFCEVTNNCGSAENRLVVWINCFFFRMSPNPADDYVEISIDESKVDLTKLTEYEIRILNSQNTLISQTKTKESLLRINTKHLVAGSYFIQIIYNGKIYTKQLIISH